MQNVYSALKIFHFKEKIDSLSPENQAILPPVHVRIKPTNICNHHCHYCAYRADGLQLGRDMGRQDSIPREKMLEVMDDVICMNVKAVTFSGGGEPLIYPYMAETLKRLIQSTVKFAALSNGSQLAGELAELFAWHGTWIRISMDGWDDASYTQYCSVTKGEFTKIIDNMANFKKMGGPCKLGVSFIVDDNNASHVYEMVCKLRDIGVDSVKVSPCIGVTQK